MMLTDFLMQMDGWWRFLLRGLVGGADYVARAGMGCATFGTLL